VILVGKDVFTLATFMAAVAKFSYEVDSCGYANDIYLSSMLYRIMAERRHNSTH
jgi:hypothetical protein